MGPEIVLGMTALSGIMGAVGSIQQGNAAADAARYQAQVARNNAEYARQNAEYSAQVGETQAQAQDLKNRATLGAIGAAQAASGLSLDSPTLRDVREGASNVLRLDTANVAQNAALRSRAYQAQASDYVAEAGLQTSRASNAESAGRIGAISSLLSSGSSFADKWTRYTAKPVPYPT